MSEPTGHIATLLAFFLDVRGGKMMKLTRKMAVYDFSAKLNNGKNKKLRDYKGKVLLIVNTASRCGFTPQYEGLQQLYSKYKRRGLEILAFPCDQFGHQEPGSDSEIKKFCTLNYGVQFPLFSKVDVNGDNEHPLYKFLKREKGGLLTDDHCCPVKRQGAGCKS
jgi:glutathione peroxidase